MKGNTTHGNIRLWNVANLALFICVVFCLRHYIINTTDSSVISLIMNLTIVISIIGLIAYLIDGYTRTQDTITVPPAIDIEADSTLTEPISQDDAELIRQTEEENRRRKEEQWAKLRLIPKRPSIRYLLRLKLIFCSII